MIVSKQSQFFITDSENNLILDLELDTEYTHISEPLQPDTKYCKNITVQCRQVNQSQGVIYIFCLPSKKIISEHPYELSVEGDALFLVYSPSSAFK